MNISNNPNVHRLTRIYQTDNESKEGSRVKPAQGSERPNAGDSVSLSTEGKFLSAIGQRLAETPDVRREKVEELRRLIAEGKYHVSGTDIADAMLREGKLP